MTIKTIKQIEDFHLGFTKVGVDNSMKMEMACEITEYLMLKLAEPLGYAVNEFTIEAENGDERYTDAAQELFNENYDKITKIIESVMGVDL
tara:strand:+ start:273 stop:545 length:273 start_codon:yes stop_codon:yes gene_type:complete